MRHKSVPRWCIEISIKSTNKSVLEEHAKLMDKAAKHQNAILVIVLVSTLMAAVDVSIVTTA